MVGVARHAPLFVKIADRLVPVDSDLALALKGAGVEAVGRYLETLTPAECADIFAAGLGILPLSKAPASPLSDAFGRKRAADLLQRADALGVPPGVHLMIDLEAQSGNHADILAYDRAISEELARPGYIPLAYIGVAQLLTGAELFTLPDIHLYWRGGSLSIPEPSCGFAVWQIPPLEQVIAGGVFDMSVTGADLRGRRPILWYGG